MYAGIHKVSGHPLVSLLNLMAILDVFVDPHEKILRTYLVKAGMITKKFSERVHFTSWYVKQRRVIHRYWHILNS